MELHWSTQYSIGKTIDRLMEDNREPRNRPKQIQLIFDKVSKEIQ